MTDEPNSNGASLPLPALERIESVCLQFEAAWQKGDKPRIEDYLGAAQGLERGQLFRELLFLDLDYRSRGDEQPSEDEYRSRFPQDSQLVSDLFEELSTGAAVTETSPAPSASVSRGETLPCPFGDYELLEVLGEGGMGIVYRARQQTPDRIVALKIIRPDRLAVIASAQRETVIERFRAETHAAASLEHEHIVPVYEVGQIEGQSFFSMRYIQGRGLEEVLRDGPLSGTDAAALLEPIAQALHFAHSREIVHRDVKPRNILLDTDRKPYVADFGLAKSFAAAHDLTQTAEAIGTPAYMSPEQAQGAAGVDHRTDIYSLGATLYELLTGRPPFRAATVAETQRQVVETEPVRLRQLNPAIDRDIETICLKCLEKDPDKRYRSAEELADELRRFQRDEPIRARPVSTWERFWRWSRRQPALAAICLLVSIIAVVSPIVAIRMYCLAKEKERARRQAGETAALLSESLEAEKRARDEARQAARSERRRRFVSDMNLVPFHWELGNIGEVKRLLHDKGPDAGEEDLREFVWHYWFQRLETRKTIESIPTPVPYAVKTAVSPDGRRIAFASTTGKVHVRRWDAPADVPDEFLLTVPGRFPIILGVAFLLDGDTIAVRGAQEVGFWNLAQQPATREALTLGVSMESSLGRNTFSNNGRYLTVTRINNCEVWDLVERRVTAKAEIPAERVNLRHFCVSDDGQRLMTSTGTLWNLKEDRAEYSLSSQLYMDQVAFAPRGDGFVTLSGSSRRLSAWDSKGHERVLAEKVAAFAVSLTRNEICWATTRNVQVLRLDAPADVQVFHYRGIMALRYDPNGKDLLALDLRKLHRLQLDRVDPDSPLSLFPQQRDSSGVALSALGTYYAACLGSEIRVWAAASGRLISKVNTRRPRPPNHLVVDDAIRDLAIGENGQIVTCSPLGDVEVWNGLTAQHVETLTQSRQATTRAEAVHRGLWSVAASSDVSVVVSMRLDGTVVVWNRTAEKEAELSVDGHITRPPKLSPDGKFLSTVDRTGKPTVWDLRKLEAVPDARAWSHPFHFRGRWAYPRIAQGGEIEICDIESGERVQRLGVHAGLTAIAATPDGKNIATFSRDGTLIIWDVRLSAPLLTVEGSPGASHLQSLVTRAAVDASTGQLAFVDEGHALALFQRGGCVRYWRLRSLLEPTSP